jgi:hypothetical protein
MAKQEQTGAPSALRRSAAEDLEVDPRVRTLVIGGSPRDRFIIVALSLAMPKDVLDRVLSEAGIAGGSPTELTADVAGKPFHHWMGKTREDVERELTDNPPAVPEGEDEVAVDEHVDAIEQAFTDRGLKLFTQDEVRKQAEQESTEPPPTIPVPPANAPPGNAGGSAPPAVDDAGKPAVATPNANDQGSQEPTYGEDQVPLSEAAGMTDDQLLSLTGIGPATVTKIRADAKERGLTQ